MSESSNRWSADSQYANIDWLHHTGRRTAAIKRARRAHDAANRVAPIRYSPLVKSPAVVAPVRLRKASPRKPSSKKKRKHESSHAPEEIHTFQPGFVPKWVAKRDSNTANRTFIRYPRGCYTWFFSPINTPKGASISRKLIVEPSSSTGYKQGSQYRAVVVHFIQGLGILNADYWWVTPGPKLQGSHQWFNFTKFNRRVKMARAAKYYTVSFALNQPKVTPLLLGIGQRQYRRTGAEEFSVAKHKPFFGSEEAKSNRKKRPRV